MFKKVLEYTGTYRKITYAAAAVLLAAVIMSVLPYLFLYQIIPPLLSHSSLSPAALAWRMAAIALCLALNAVLYIKGLDLSHQSAYHTLENLRIFLQGRLEKQPLGTIQEKGTGTLKKIFIDDIESIELLLAHALPEGLANLSVPFLLFIAMFAADWKLAFLSLLSLPLGAAAMCAMYKSGKSNMDAYYGAARKMNNTIVEYINGMEVVKVFNRDGAVYLCSSLYCPFYPSCRSIFCTAGILIPSRSGTDPLYVFWYRRSFNAVYKLPFHPAPDKL